MRFTVRPVHDQISGCLCTSLVAHPGLKMARLRARFSFARKETTGCALESSESPYTTTCLSHLPLGTDSLHTAGLTACLWPAQREPVKGAESHQQSCDQGNS